MTPIPRRRLVVAGLVAAVACSALVAVLARPELSGTTAPGRPDILLVTIDSLRADHLNAYGYARQTSPRLDGLAEDGVRFEHAISQASWTLASMASVHTSLLPSHHGAVRAENRISKQVPTLAQALMAEGYRTIAVVSHNFVDGKHGFAEGFEVFDESQITGHETLTSAALTRVALAKLSANLEPTEEGPRPPFFLWVHYFDPHFTYLHHPAIGFVAVGGETQPERVTSTMLSREGREALDVAHVTGVYDEEIRHTDLHIGKLFDGFRNLGVWDSTVTLVTSDHGEYFMERGRYKHSNDLYEELVHVPLIISGALPEGLAGAVVSQTVETRSIPATIMGLVGVSQHAFKGQDLLQVAAGKLPVEPAFAEVCKNRGPELLRRKRAVVLHGWKLIHNLDDGRRELYDLGRDPNERNNLFGSDEPEARQFRKQLMTYLKRTPAGDWGVAAVALQLTAEEQERLRALGYGE